MKIISFYFLDEASLHEVSLFINGESIQQPITQSVPYKNIEVENFNNFSVLVNYSVKALPLKELVINNFPIPSSIHTCIENDQTDCMEINENILIINNDFCPKNNTVEMIFDYNLNNTLNCAITKLEPIKYYFDIVCKFK